MRKIIIASAISVSSITLLTNCTSRLVAQSTAPVLNTEQKGLKDYFKNYFKMGAAVGPQSLKGEDSALIVQEFNSITAENAMKMGPIHPEENRYYWKDADAIVDFAQRNGIAIRGHNLLWHEQTPKWLFTDNNGKQVTKAFY